MQAAGFEMWWGSKMLIAYWLFGFWRGICEQQANGFSPTQRPGGRQLKRRVLPQNTDP